MNILFVCTGNTCRSPLAEVLCVHLRFGWQARSRGLAAYENAPATSHAIEAARAYGCNLSEHRAHMVAESDMVWADAVYGMTTAHAAMLRTVFPAHAGKVKTMPDGDVSDPLGGTMSEYRLCAAQIEQNILQI